MRGRVYVGGELSLSYACAICGGGPAIENQGEDAIRHHFSSVEKPVDASTLLFYYRVNTGKEVILKYMSSYHSEVAAA